MFKFSMCSQLLPTIAMKNHLKIPLLLLVDFYTGSFYRVEPEVSLISPQ